MKNWQTGVLVIGSGLAGIRAAMEARRAGDHVLVVSEAPVSKASNTAISKGYFAISGAGGPGDSPVQHLSDIIDGGCRVNDPELISVMVNNLEDEAGFLLECGVSLTVRDDGSLVRAREMGVRDGAEDNRTVTAR